MSEKNNNDQNTEFNAGHSDDGQGYNPNASDGQQYYSQNDNGSGGQPYYGQNSGDNGQPDYNSGQYGACGQNAGYGDGQYTGYDPNGGQQYYGQNNGYDNGQQYYGQNNGYNNGQQYYGQNPGYNNGQQYYGQNNGYNNGQQYYGQNGGYSGQPYYGQNNGYNNGQPDYNNGQYGSYEQNNGYNNGQYTGYNPNGGQQYYGGQPYANPQATYQQAQPAAQPISNIFYYILMALTAISTIATIAVVISMLNSLFDGSIASTIDPESLSGNGYASMYAFLVDLMANTPAYSVYSVFNSVFRFGILVISVIDIVQVRQKGYPILGMVLFTIFCKPGYFIWRAHVTKQKKLVPVLFTVFYVLLFVIYFGWCFSLAFRYV